MFRLLNLQAPTQKSFKWDDISLFHLYFPTFHPSEFFQRQSLCEMWRQLYCVTFLYVMPSYTWDYMSILAVPLTLISTEILHDAWFFNSFLARFGVLWILFGGADGFSGSIFLFQVAGAGWLPRDRARLTCASTMWHAKARFKRSLEMERDCFPSHHASLQTCPYQVDWLGTG